jgi:hypothetical protein
MSSENFYPNYDDVEYEYFNFYFKNNEALKNYNNLSEELNFLTQNIS